MPRSTRQSAKKHISVQGEENGDHDQAKSNVEPTGCKQAKTQNKEVKGTNVALEFNRSIEDSQGLVAVELNPQSPR